MKPIHYFNGEFLHKEDIHISVDNVGFLRGFGVFEFFKAKGSSPIFIEDHLERLYRSAAGLGLEVPLSKEQFHETVKQLLVKNGMAYSSVKIVLSGGPSTDGFTPGPTEVLILNMPFADLDASVYAQGVSLMLCQYERDFPHIKSLYYANAVALQPEWKKQGHIDVLYYKGEYVSEVSRCNVFMVKDGVIKTNQEGVLSGITRMHAIEALKNRWPVEIAPLKLKELLSADEVFITSTTKKILPVVKLGDYQIGTGSPGLVSKAALEAFNAYIEDHLAGNQAACIS
ncbi:aminotransferase class IV [Roseivirga thermotolerans]|uniref:aminotransferase class IV n=1 Tax=Roseivirga thermotolerans TaxID=1758176 RepID=UPI00273EA0AE|nr:aminotransferase class IV [Roseivirga thermotolerans]